MRRQFPSPKWTLAALAFAVFLATTFAPMGTRLPSAGVPEPARVLATDTDRSAAVPMPTLQGKKATDYLKQHESYASLEEAIAATRYRVVPASRKDPNSVTGSGVAYQASNPQQGYQTLFTPEQILVMPRTAATPAPGGEAPVWQVGLKLTGYGYGERLSAIRPGVITTHANRIEIARGLQRQRGTDGKPESNVDVRDASLVEWYVNRAEGLEQGFTISERPSAGIDKELLRLRLELSGSLRPEVNAAADAIALLDPAGEQILAYDHLVVTDRSGQRLASHFEVSVGAVSIVVADANAVYPVTIDPTLTQQAYLKASNTGAGDLFGLSVAVSGDTAVVGAPYEDSNATGVDGSGGNNSAPDSGAAYVFVRLGGTWSQQAYLKASNTGVNDQFGTSVAVSGDTVVVGAPYEDSSATGVSGNQNDNAGLDSGAAYVFTRSGGVWSQQAYLKASTTSGVVGNGFVFGYSVAVSGDTVVAGALQEASNATGVNGNQANSSAAFSGAAYVFFRSGGTWSQQAYLKASNTQANDYFGVSVAASGETVVVGAYFEDSSATGVDGDQNDNLAGESGAAYVFVRSSGTWSQQAYLKASNAGAGDWFGVSVAASGDTVVIGALNEDSNATSVDGDQNNNLAGDSGAAYIFVRSSGLWSQQAYLKASTTRAGDWFGVSVALSGDAAVVGAQFEGSAPLWAGGAFVFARSGGIWSQQTYLKASNAGANDRFGASVAVSGDSVVIGAFSEGSNATGVNGNQSNNSAGQSGAAYVYSPTVPHPPVANAGPDQVVEATSASGAPVSLDGSASSDADGDTLTFEWRDATLQLVGNMAVVNLTLALGAHTFTLTVDDGNGGVDSDTVQVTVEDTLPPSISIPSPTGTSYALNQQIAASYTCTDVVSGIASCVGTVASGADIATGSAGSHDFTVTATDNLGNTSSITVTYTVARGVPVIAWANPAAITYPTALGGTQLNATASVPGTFTYTPAAGTVLNAGAGQILHLDFVPTDAVNYTNASADATITVNQATPVITWANPAAITYPTALGGTQLNATANVAGSFTYTPAAGTVLHAGAGQILHTDFVPADAVNYTNASADVTITVNQATPVITWANPAAINYPTAVGGTQLNATANVAGTFTYTPAAGTVLNAGAGQTLHAAFVPTDAVNYATASADVTITVNQATPSITWASPTDIVYGTALSAVQLNATSSVPGALTYTPAAGTILLPGPNQPLSVLVAPADPLNYSSAVANVFVTVLQGSHFQQETRYAVGTQPRSVEVGDFNADGFTDVVSANASQNSVRVLLGSGTGTFSAAATYPVGTTPLSVTVGDFDNDARADLAVANGESNNLSLLLGNGNGTFQAAINYAVGVTPWSVKVGDFNIDGNADLATANISSNDVSVLLGNGDGSFQAAITLPAAGGPQSVAVGDLNADGWADLAVANFGGARVSVFLGRGDGSFQAAVNYNVGPQARSVFIGDFDGNGRPDLVVPNGPSNDVRILLGSGDGTFQAAVSYPGGTNPESALVGDFNGDSRSDLLVVNNLGNDTSLLLGNGDGSFQGPVNYQVGTNPVSVAVGDFNADGRPDLVVANGGSNDVSVLLGAAGARLNTSTTMFATPSPSASDQAVTIAALVSSVAGAPTGVVTFEDDTTPLGTRPLIGGRATLVTTFAAGRHRVTASYAGDALSLGSTSAVLQYDVLAATPAGFNVQVVPVDLATGASPATLTFAQVTQAGSTAITISPSGPPPPAGFLLGAPATYYELTTTAVFVPPITVCINYTGVSFGDETQLRLFHFESGAWADRTSSLDTSTDVICANVDSLSPFAIFERLPPTTPVITWANPAAITYQTALGGAQLNATASVAGTFTYTPAAGTVLNAGAGQTLHVAFVPTDAVNYTNASADVTITVNQAPTVTTAGNVSAVYNASSQTVVLGATVTGSVVSTGQVSFTVKNGAATIGSSVTGSVNGSGVATADFTLPGGTPVGNYSIEAAFTSSTNFANSQGAATLSVLQPSSVNTTLSGSRDSFLRSGADDTNEGANERLRIQNSGNNRAVVAFDLTGISTVGLQSATLVLDIAENSNNWGANGRLVDVHRLLVDWTEGNGRNDVMVGGGPAFRGTGEGVTWHCSKDTNVVNQSANCSPLWNGGSFAAATAPGSLHTNGLGGQVSWDVTADVLAGANFGWTIRKREENQNGQVRYYSREGAALAGNADLAPRLVLVYQTAISGTRAYVANYVSNDVSVIDTATNTLVATVPVGLTAHAVALNSEGTRAYVANYGSHDVSVIDTATNSVVATVPVGMFPRDLVVNPPGTRVYVGNYNSGDLSVIDTATNTVVATIPLMAGCVGVAINAAGTRVYVVYYGGANMSVIDTATNTVVATVLLAGGSTDVAINPAGTRVYVPNGNNVSVIDTATNTVVATVPVGLLPFGVAVNPAGTRVYVANAHGNSVSVIDTATDTVVATVSVGAGPFAVAVNGDGTRAYVTNFDGNDLSVIDTATNTVVATVTVGISPTGLAVK